LSDESKRHPTDKRESLEFQCFDISTALGIASNATNSENWEAATISIKNGTQVVAPDVRSARVLKRTKAPKIARGWRGRSFALHELKRTQAAHDLLLPAAERFPEN
jgi:hypothetical protein